MVTMHNKRFKKILVIILISASAVFTFGFLLQDKESHDFKLAKNLDIYFSLFRELNTFYVDEIDPEKLVTTSINSMLATLDPYTVFYSADNTGDLDFMTTGKYGGLGSLIRKSGDYIVVTDIYKGFPADQHGIKPGDLMIKAGGKSLKGVSSDEASSLLKGDPGSEVEITFLRNGKEFTEKFKREKIYVPAVPYYGMLNTTTGYIRFTGFTQNCIDEVKNALVDLKENKGAKSIILDLRNNPGGLINEAVEIVNLFVGPGQEVVSTRGRLKQYDSNYLTTKQAVAAEMPLVVLINRGSASASEIVAGAIQDLDRGVIIGERSYGKGLVQIARPLSYKTELKLTTAKYYIPSGRCIQAVDFSHRNEDGSVGVIPDSLIKTFSTKNGRQVKDGGGIIPDINEPSEMLSRFSTAIYLQNMVFDYVTKYYWSHPAITLNPADFRITDSTYADFGNYLRDKKFSYQSAAEVSLSSFVTEAKNDGLFDSNKESIEKIQKTMEHSLDNDLSVREKEVRELLEGEIVGRYFYDSGAIEYGLSSDKQLSKAINVLQDKSLYDSTLSVTSGPIK
jgi:carboxyl-terminal processing protease